MATQSLSLSTSYLLWKALVFCLLIPSTSSFLAPIATKQHRQVLHAGTSPERSKENEWAFHSRREQQSFATHASTDMTSQQAKVDDYLEFLERRYQRLHSDDTAASAPQQTLYQHLQPQYYSPDNGKFSTWRWLFHGLDEHTMEQENNALEVLGLAGIASERLLQKYHRQHTGEHHHALPIAAETAIDTIAIPTSLATVAVATILDQRRRFLDFQTMKLRAAFTRLRKALLPPSTIPKAFNKVIEMAGGKKNILWALSFTSMLLVVLVRSLIPVLVSRSTQSA